MRIDDLFNVIAEHKAPDVMVWVDIQTNENSNIKTIRITRTGKIPKPIVPSFEVADLVIRSQKTMQCCTHLRSTAYAGETWHSENPIETAIEIVRRWKR